MLYQPRVSERSKMGMSLGAGYVILVIINPDVHSNIFTFSVYFPLCLHWKYATFNFL